MHAGTAGGRCRALLATMECSRGTTSDEEDVEDGGDLPSPLEGEDDEDEGNLTSGVADCAAAVRRERVESRTRRLLAPTIWVSLVFILAWHCPDVLISVRRGVGSGVPDAVATSEPMHRS
jgi:hypothetical protein